MRAALLLIVPLLMLVTVGSIAVVRARAGNGSPDQTQGNPSAELRATTSATTGGASVSAITALDELQKTEDRHRTSRLLLPQRSSSAVHSGGSDAWYVGMASIAVLLAAAGGIAFAARRIAPRPGAGALHVVSRVSLSPKHTVYLLRAGGRVLLVGTGPQGAPSLISELDEIPPIEPASRHGEEP
jgi:flagellar protein FliO/FliZ